MEAGKFNGIGEMELFNEAGGAAPERKKLMGYIPSCFILAPFPSRNLKPDVIVYEKKYNNIEMKLAGTKGIPGGRIARDMLVLFTSHAVYEKNSDKEGAVRLHFDSIINFMKSMGYDNISKYGNVLDTLDRLSVCSLSFEARKKEKLAGNDLITQLQGGNKNIAETGGYRGAVCEGKPPFC